MRKEKDSLGERLLPDEACYGIQTLRAVENFAVSDDTFNRHPNVVRAVVEVKKACALTNRDIGALAPDVANAIVDACDHVLAGGCADQFPVNVFRGCGTSINMNVNEVLGNLANERLTGHKGTDRVHPNTHVNMCQSSNDVFPTAASIVLYRESGTLLDALAEMEDALRDRARELRGVVRVGRTCLQDAVPLTFGQSLSGYAALFARTRHNLAAHRKRGARGLLGATAVGTGLGVQPGFMKSIYPNLSKVAGFAIRPHRDLFDGMRHSDGIMTLSSLVRNAAAACGQVARDCLLLASGPGFGFGDIALDPASPEPDGLHACKLIIQIAHRVSANDWAICMAAQSGEPDIAPSGGIKLMALLESLDLLSRGAPLLAELCVRRLEPERGRCRRHAEESMSLAAIAGAILGYGAGGGLVKAACAQGLTCKEAAIREGLFSRTEAEKLFDPQTLTDRAAMERLIRRYASKAGGVRPPRTE